MSFFPKQKESRTLVNESNVGRPSWEDLFPQDPPVHDTSLLFSALHFCLEARLELFPLDEGGLSLQCRHKRTWHTTKADNPTCLVSYCHYKTFIKWCLTLRLEDLALYIIIIRLLSAQKWWRNSLRLGGSSIAQWSQKPCLVTHLLSEAGWLCDWGFWLSLTCAGESLLLSLLQIKSWRFVCSVPVTFKAVLRAAFGTWHGMWPWRETFKVGRKLT